MVTGPAEPLTGPAYVAALTPVSNIAVGDETPWGVAAELARLVPGTGTDTYDGEHENLAADVLRARGTGASSRSSATRTATRG